MAIRKQAFVLVNAIAANSDIPINVVYIKKCTKNLLWHQCLRYPCDEYLCKANWAIKGMLQFKAITSILNTCPTCCIRANNQCPTSSTYLDWCTQHWQSRHPISQAPNLAPHQTCSTPLSRLSIDFSFSRMGTSIQNFGSSFISLYFKRRSLLLLLFSKTVISLLFTYPACVTILLPTSKYLWVCMCITFLQFYSYSTLLIYISSPSSLPLIPNKNDYNTCQTR